MALQGWGACANPSGLLLTRLFVFQSFFNKTNVTSFAAVGVARRAVRRLREQSLVESALVLSFVSLSSVVLVTVLDIHISPLYAALRHAAGALLRAL